MDMIRRQQRIGMVRPPPGITPNFDHPHTQQGQIRNEIISLVVISSICLMLRLGSRVYITRSLGSDDYTCVAAAILTFASSATQLKAVEYGVGVHAYDIERIKFDAKNYFEWGVATYATFIAGTGMVKISILLLYLRIFPTGRDLRIAMKVLLVLVAGYTISCLLSLIFGCQPIGRLTDRSKPGTCIDFVILIEAHSGLTIAFDVLMVLAPLPTIWKLKLRRREKIVVSALFMAGLLVCISSAIRLALTFVPPEELKDFTWSQGRGSFWTMMEIHISVICSCMPAVNTLVHSLVPWLREHTTRRSTRRSSSNHRSSSGYIRSSDKRPVRFDDSVVRPIELGESQRDILRPDAVDLVINATGGQSSKLEEPWQGQGIMRKVSYEVGENQRGVRSLDV
ncbi:MAG: hypothetical protein M1816_000315 [Peltula sp. TS41687]|nr:MAG: hypothetical protein M1816_000315 [Peltula sp. TS41687]